MFVPLLVALYYDETVVPFVVTIAVTVARGTALERLEPDPDSVPARDGPVVAASGRRSHTDTPETAEARERVTDGDRVTVASPLACRC
ncbi:hypothetical protein C8039_04370 [Halogeometricum sp. wsp3]|nr:hypothetical protein C8039_04370 [Halogeometricum sp. wsp3]